MLLNSTKVKIRIQKNFNEKIKFEMLQKSPVTSNVRKYFIYEGDKLGVIHSDENQVVEPMKKLEASVTILKDEIGPSSLSNIIEDISSQMADAQTKVMFETLGKAVESVGNTVDGKGKPVSAELMLEMMGKIHIDFVNGQPQMPSIACSPDSLEKFKKAVEDMMTVEPYKAEYIKMMEKKKKDFDERENRRKLVN